MINILQQYCRPNTMQVLLVDVCRVGTISAKVLDRSSHVTEGERAYMNEDNSNFYTHDFDTTVVDILNQHRLMYKVLRRRALARSIMLHTFTYT
jgi:hypothetical protein